MAKVRYHLFQNVRPTWGKRYSSRSEVDRSTSLRKLFSEGQTPGLAVAVSTLRGKKEHDSGLSATGMAVPRPTCIISGLGCVSKTVAENGVSDTSHF